MKVLTQVRAANLLRLADRPALNYVANRRHERPTDISGEENVQRRYLIAFAASVRVPSSASHNKAQAVPRHNNGERAERGANWQEEASMVRHFIDMQDDKVDEERNERPNFFWIPAPESSPAEIRPSRAENNTDG